MNGAKIVKGMKQKQNRVKKFLFVYYATN